MSLLVCHAMLFTVLWHAWCTSASDAAKSLRIFSTVSSALSSVSDTRSYLPFRTAWSCFSAESSCGRTQKVKHEAHLLLLGLECLSCHIYMASCHIYMAWEQDIRSSTCMWDCAAVSMSVFSWEVRTSCSWRAALHAASCTTSPSDSCSQIEH